MLRKNTAKQATATPQPSDLQLDLLLVLFEGPHASGDLVTEVGTLRESAVPLATFYRQLQRAIDVGWIQVDEASEAEATSPGRPERHYRITEAGRRLLQTGLERLERRVERGRAIGLLSEPAP